MFLRDKILQTFDELSNKIYKAIFHKTFFVTTLQDKTMELDCDTSSSAKLGKGSFGTVYLAQDPWKHQVALKIQQIQNSDDGYDLIICQREIEIMAELTKASVPHVVHLVGSSIEKTSADSYKVCIAMTYADHGSLESWLIKGSQFSPNERLSIAYRIVEGLDFMHNMGILHNDLKTTNVVMDVLFRPKLCDFGHAKFIGEDTQNISGTPYYLSPELLLGYFCNFNACQTKASDVYSLSLLIYCLYADKKMPFENFTTIPKLVTEVCFRETRETIPATCPPNVKQLIEMGWLTNSQYRPTTEQALMILRSQQTTVASPLNTSNPLNISKKTRGRSNSLSNKEDYLQPHRLFSGKNMSSSAKPTELNSSAEKKNSLLL